MYQLWHIINRHLKSIVPLRSLRECKLIKMLTKALSIYLIDDPNNNQTKSKVQVVALMVLREICGSSSPVMAVQKLWGRLTPWKSERHLLLYYSFVIGQYLTP